MQVLICIFWPGRQAARVNASKAFGPFLLLEDMKGSLEEVKNKMMVDLASTSKPPLTKILFNVLVVALAKQFVEYKTLVHKAAHKTVVANKLYCREKNHLKPTSNLHKKFSMVKFQQTFYYNKASKSITIRRFLN
ncbi:hypothetical protein CUMW_165470 [Citrus unshiu]|nr:hypothetical protein CUMW_165470 [Citrus unshiu]